MICGSTFYFLTNLNSFAVLITIFNLKNLRKNAEKVKETSYKSEKFRKVENNL